MIKREVEEPEALRAKKKDFSEWYNQIISVAEIIDKRYDVKGMFVWLPYGWEIMINIKKYWDKIFKESGIKEMYFPLIVPQNYAEMNKKWFDGFKEEAFWVGGKNEKKFTHILRPTGEPAMYPLFKIWTKTHTDLPIRIYENVSSFRYETKHTRPLIRDREIVPWFEIHTTHATQKEAEQEAKLHQEIYSKIWDYLALPYIRVKKPQWECFPGALGAIEDYTIMPTGKAMENGSVNILGQAYAKAFGITYKDENEKEHHAWQVCTGNGERYLAAVIAVHGDDKGLILPPTIAPIQAIVIPIYTKKDKEKVLKKVKEITTKIKKSVRTESDLRETSPGSKYYDWELKGVPIRIEVGPKDIQKKQVILVRRDTGKKTSIKEKDLNKKLKTTLEAIQKNLYTKAKQHFTNHLQFVNKLSDIPKQVNKGKTINSFWCGLESCYDKIQKQGEGLDPFGADIENRKEGKCIVCSKKTKDIIYVSNTY